MFRRLIQREWTSNESDGLCTSRERGIVVVNWAAERWDNVRKVGSQGANFTKGTLRLAVTREVHPTEVANAAIRVDEMPAVCAYSTSCILGPIVCMGWNRSYNICRISRRMEYWLKCMRVVRWRDVENNN